MPASTKARAGSVAVVGSGVSGLSAAYLFEAGDVCGGHALTVDSTAGPVDLGFQVRSATAARPTDAIPYPREDSD
jgi:predicted NAD/FAD-binding protein